MLIPEHWAEARLQAERDGRPVTVRRFGWSDATFAEAQANAEARARAALARILAGEALPRRELKRAYNGSEGVPIREEIVQRHGDTIITRNSYGALCLNTPDCLFADVDFHEGPSWRMILLSTVSLVTVAAAIGLAGHLKFALIAAVAALTFAYPVAIRLHQAATRMGGGSERIARRRIEKYVERHSHWHLRLYRTPGGLRVLAVHATFSPADPEVANFFQAIGADPVYVRMCLRQQCFRARVSPKPWRIGIAEHMRPRTVWPIEPTKLPERCRWIEAYQLAAQGYASCRYIDSLGSSTVNPTAHQVQNLHDELCRAILPLPIA